MGSRLLGRLVLLACGSYRRLQILGRQVVEPGFSLFHDEAEFGLASSA
jgi:hypothetical protein